MDSAARLLRETLLIATAGLLLALGANALSPYGLRLSRDYFPGGEITKPVPAVPISPASNAPTPATVKQAAAAQRLQQRGLQLLQGEEVFTLFQDPRYQQALVVFVDARDEQHYAAGHIPGAWQFNHYRPETSLPMILPLCLTAQKVVVYCTGGDCEDSEFAAIMLRDSGVNRENLFVYTGGITEWKALGRPVETGARASGQLLKP